VLIGTPTSGEPGGQIEQILLQLARARSRQQSRPKRSRSPRSRNANCARRAACRQQSAITEAELSIVVQSNTGKAELARAQQEATKIQTLATQRRKRSASWRGRVAQVKAIAGADAERAARVGVAQAMGSRSRYAPTAARASSSPSRS